jgi:F-type H+-transporting ATPase subunit b
VTPILALVAGGVGQLAAIAAQAEETAEPGLVINLFWILVVAANFLVFLLLAWYLGFRRLSGTLESRRVRIEQGLRDADEARKEREEAAAERLATLTTARQEANEVLTRAQKQADDNRERALADTRGEIERLRERATADIESERQRALADVRAQVADLALLAAGRVVGETMTGQRERRLVDDFLTELNN